MADYQITCIVPDGSDPDGRIDAVGGPFGANDEFGILPIEDAIAAWKAGHTFWTADFLGNRAEAYVAGSPMTGEYLTTTPDGIFGNNLLNLPRCPQ